ncbi:hypothetical protein BH09ACT3_BH09ACT3_00850 [soil metagenome]
MKRPEGFDRPIPPPQKRASPARPPAAARVHARTPTSPKNKPTQPLAQPRADRRQATSAERQLTAAAKQRRRYERSEVKRFTRSRRRRRNRILAAVAIVAVLAAAIIGAVFSPLLALGTISVTGTSRLDAKAVSAALDDHLGTPLALVDFEDIRRELGAFTLIRSYVTESVPPHTLVIRIQERAPIGSIATAKGFDVVDAAGVVIESGAERIAGLPMIEVGSDGAESPAFESAVEVLLALPADLVLKVDRISAKSKDDVTLTLAGAGQLVDWGSPEQSALKARVLATLIAHQNPNALVRYDVSAPNTPVIGAP